MEHLSSENLLSELSRYSNISEMHFPDPFSKKIQDKQYLFTILKRKYKGKTIPSLKNLGAFYMKFSLKYMSVHASIFHLQTSSFLQETNGNDMKQPHKQYR